MWLTMLPVETRARVAEHSAAVQSLFELALDSGGAATAVQRKVYAEAYQLGRAVLESEGVEVLNRCFRDQIAEVVARMHTGAGGDPLHLAHFLNQLNDGFWRAYSDSLQRTIDAQHVEKIQQELSLAKRIQERLLPKSIPHIPGFDIAGRVVPAGDVGGDYWSVKEYPDDGIVTFKLADVTGHGIAAATLVAAVKFISGGYYRGAKTCSQVMERTNQVLLRETPSDILVPMVYGWLYPMSREMSIVNAGHSPVFVYRAADQAFEDIEPTGPVLGLLITRYSDIRLRMAPSDIFFSCSDGITEATKKDPLGVDRVKALLAELADLPANAIADAMIDAARRHYGEQVDDMSLIIIKRTE
jgi:serine phosphatase RsbU (regulator of sigma subunit)